MSADLPPLPPAFTQRGGDPNLLEAELLHIIRDAITNHPRSQQTRIGPSEIGHPCTRRIAYKLAGVPETNHPDGWKATIGTAVHAWLADVFTAHNLPLHADRFYIEEKVTAGNVTGLGDIDGSCDIYDRITATAIDWKITTRNKIKDYRRYGPGQQYRVQANAYARGWTHAGNPVDTVAVMFLPRDGTLTDAWMWHEPYDEQPVIDALTRLEGVQALVAAAGPAAAAALPTADAFCTFCPYFTPGATDLARACPGDAARDTHRPDSTVQALIGA